MCKFLLFASLCVSSFFISASFGQTAGLIHTFVDATPTELEAFGFSVAIDGNHVLVGAHRGDVNAIVSGQAHLFDATTGNLVVTYNSPSPEGGRFGSFGFSVAIDGNHVLIGAPFDRLDGERVGRAFLFNATTGDLLFTFDDPTPYRWRPFRFFSRN